MSEYIETTVAVKCPKCEKEFDQKVEVKIYEPSVDVEAI